MFPQSGMMACDCRGCLIAAGEENPSTKIMLRAESDQIFNLLFFFCRWPNKRSACIPGDAGKQMLAGQDPYWNFSSSKTPDRTQTPIVSANDQRAWVVSAPLRRPQ